jgi:putative hydrolase of the HAD superfamily
MRTPALIFDFGNVLAFFDYLRAFDRLAVRLGVTGAVLRERLLDRGFAQIHRQFERGRITPDQFAAEVMARSGLTMPYEEFTCQWNDIFSLNESVAGLIEPLKARGYTVLLGSNTNVLHAAHFRRQFAATLDRFDDLICSHEVGYLKPDREFYAACVAATTLTAASCVFVDDLEENVDGARRAGLIGIQYADTPRLIADLRRLGVEIPPGTW